MKKSGTPIIILLAAVALQNLSCTSTRQLPSMLATEGELDLLLPASASGDEPGQPVAAQTFRKIEMKPDKDGVWMDSSTGENGETVIRDSIQTSYVTAKFTNTSERMGMVDIGFLIKTPAGFVEENTQVRLHPRLTFLQDTLSLADVVLTNKTYRDWQIGGEKKYSKYLETIEHDTTVFIRKGLLDKFLDRNHPAALALGERDQNYFIDTLMHGGYDVTAKEASDHYVRRWSRIRNHRRIERDEYVRDRMMPDPVRRSGIVLDSIITSATGDIYYLYNYSVKTQKGMRKIVASLDGEVCDTNGDVYAINPPEPLTFYISSIASLMRDESYRRKVSRNVNFKVTSRIQFPLGSTEIDLTLDSNAAEIEKTRKCLKELLAMEGLALDNITLRSYASPEGTESSNRTLTDGRVRSVCDLFQSDFPNISFRLQSGGENWAMLDTLVARDRSISDSDKAFYRSQRSIANADRREAALKQRSFYNHLKQDLYPQLRVVTFDCSLHRTEVTEEQGYAYITDKKYEEGLQALRDMDYEKAERLLKPYKDYNSALAYIGTFKNYNARLILSHLEPAADVDYLKTIVNIRFQQDDEALKTYRSACMQNKTYISRGNLDPEVSAFKKRMHLDDNELYSAADGVKPANQ